MEAAVKNLSSLFIALLYQFTLFPQTPNIEWAKTFGGSGNEGGIVVIETSDNGYIAGGSNDEMSYVIKLNNLGDSLWTSTSRFSGNYSQEGVVPELYELENGYYIMGFAGYPYGGLLKVSSLGDSIQYFWQGYTGWAELTHLSKTADDNYLVSIGNWYSYMGGGRLIKIDALGNTIWEGWGSNSAIRYVIQTYDGGFATVGKKAYGMGCWMGILLSKWNSDGDTVWTKIIYADSACLNGNISSKCLRQTTDGGYFILCNEHNDSTGNYNIVLFRTNEFGDTLWTKKYGGSGIDRGEYFTETSDGGYLIVGSTESFGAGGSDVWIVKIDSLGNTEWTKTIGGPESDYGSYIKLTSDSGYIVTGSTNSFGHGGSDVWVIKLTHNPVSVDNIIKIVNQYKLIQNYPNPFNPSTKIRYSIPHSSNVSIKVFDILGNEIQTLVNEEKSAGTYQLTWYAESLPSGVYFCQLKAETYVDTKKMVLLK